MFILYLFYLFISCIFLHLELIFCFLSFFLFIFSPGYQTLKKIHLVPDHWREEMETEDGGCVRVRGLCGGLGVNSTAVSSRYPHFIS